MRQSYLVFFVTLFVLRYKSSLKYILLLLTNLISYKDIFTSKHLRGQIDTTLLSFFEGWVKRSMQQSLIRPVNKTTTFILNFKL